MVSELKTKCNIRKREQGRTENVLEMTVSFICFKKKRHPNHPCEKVIAPLNVMAGCIAVSHNTCNRLISLSYAVEEFYPTLLCSPNFIQTKPCAFEARAAHLSPSHSISDRAAGAAFRKSPTTPAVFPRRRFVAEIVMAKTKSSLPARTFSRL